LRLYPDQEHTIVEVWDTGQGMTPEFIRNSLFKPFQTTKPAGMGIGVYESAQYIRELGGDIAVSSELGVGTRVKVTIPRHTGVAADAGKAKAAA
jgi:signal transduction histidine kinase